MSDRELLEIAAKATGMWKDGVYYGSPEWNPLADDGDALRIAVKISLFSNCRSDRFHMFNKFFKEELDNDLRPSEATRRAITRAAAEIGKGLIPDSGEKLKQGGE